MGDSVEDWSSSSESSVTICIIVFWVLLSGFVIKASSFVFIEGSGVIAGSFVNGALSIGRSIASGFRESSSNISLSSSSTIFDFCVDTVDISVVGSTNSGDFEICISLSLLNLSIAKSSS